LLSKTDLLCVDI